MKTDKAKIDHKLRRRVENISAEIRQAGGRALYVGGVVRDQLLDLVPKDVDVEVHGLPLEALQSLLNRHGRVRLVGRRFGVLILDGLGVEWSVPRRDSRGRHPVVDVQPDLGFREASRRRDLTMNAMLRDVLSGELIDPWNGREDIEQRVLRTPDPELFVQDPLRLYRVMQFAARFEMTPEETLQRTCREMDIGGVSRERIEEEFEKMWLRSRRPSLGLRWLESTGRMGEVLPELVALRGAAQDPQWHPEGDVWAHTLQVVDAAAALRVGDSQRDLMLLWAALLHDIGKPETATVKRGRIRTPLHDKLGAEKAGEVLGRMVGRESTRRGAVKLVAHHMKPLQFHQNESPQRAFKRLAVKLYPEADLELLIRLARADYRGTNPESDLPLEGDTEMMVWFERMTCGSRVENAPEAPVLLGRHLLDTVPAGPELGRLLEQAYRIQLDEGLVDAAALKKRVTGGINDRVEKKVRDD
jgi:tRNA nucleotidyltransferase (CCA-adding enzyme)